MIQRCHTETGNAFSPGITPALMVRLRSFAALLSPASPFKTDVAYSSGTSNGQGSGSFATPPLRRWAQIQKHSTTDSLASRVNLLPIHFSVIGTKTLASKSQNNFTYRRFALRPLWRETTKFLFRFLPTTSNRSSVQASTRELFSPTLRLLWQFPTTPDANVCHWDDALNHTAQRSAEAQLRVVRPQQLSASGNQPGVEKTGPSSCQERTHQNEENNVSQCIANRGMSDRDHRRRAA